MASVLELAQSAPMLQMLDKSASSVYTNERGEAKGAIEQGPKLVRFLAFCAGVASLVCLGLHLISPANVLRPVTYILHVYLGIFALTTMIFEADPLWIEKVNGANAYLELLIKHCGFLCHNMGRGLFYIFQGTLWMSYFNSLADIMVLGVAGSLCSVGILSVLMHFGILPQQIVDKTMHHAQKIMAHVGETAKE